MQSFPTHLDEGFAFPAHLRGFLQLWMMISNSIWSQQIEQKFQLWHTTIHQLTHSSESSRTAPFTYWQRLKECCSSMQRQYQKLRMNSATILKFFHQNIEVLKFGSPTEHVFVTFMERLMLSTIALVFNLLHLNVDMRSSCWHFDPLQEKCLWILLSNCIHSRADR